MANIIRTALGSAAVAAALTGVVALGVTPATASAKSAPPGMHISATGGDNTAVDNDGTEGSFTDSVQGRQDTDGDQDAFDMIKSAEASPQEKAKNKMTK